MGSDTVRPEGRQGDGAAYIVIFASYFAFVLSTWVIILSNDPASLGWFRFHPLLQSLSIGCFIYGILTLQPTSQPSTKAAGLERHKIAMLGLGIPLILLGTLAVFLNKNSNDAPHFTSLHGRFGLVVVVWLVLQALVGGSTVWFDGAAWGGGMRPKLVWKYHRLSGYILFPILLLTAYLGGDSYLVATDSNSFVRVLAYWIAPLLILVGVYSRIRVSKMKFF
jgi:hypothetical protein